MAVFDRDRRAYLGKVLLGGVAAAVVAGTFSFFHARNAEPKTPDDVAALMSRDPAVGRFLPVLKRDFPNDYQTMMLTALQDGKSGMPMAEAHQAGFAMSSSILLRHKPDIAHAPDTELLAIARAEGGLLNRLPEPLCAKLFTTGLGPTDVIPDDAKMPASDVAIANLNAARAGLDHPITRSAPGPQDGQALVARMRAHGLAEAQASAFIGGAIMAAQPRDQCAIGRAVFVGLGELPTPQGGKIMSAMVAAS